MHLDGPCNTCSLVQSRCIHLPCCTIIGADLNKTYFWRLLLWLGQANRIGSACNTNTDSRSKHEQFQNHPVNSLQCPSASVADFLSR